MTPFVERSRPYSLAFDTSERKTLVTALGKFSPAEESDSLIARILDLAPRLPITVSATIDQAGGKAAAASILSPPPAPTPSDRWAKKKPESWETIEVPISKVEERSGANGKFLRVTWPNQGRGFAYGSVFDEGLFPFIWARQGKKAALHTVKSGKYINIVGVRV
jgi:hypothetical protein